MARPMPAYGQTAACLGRKVACQDASEKDKVVGNGAQRAQQDGLAKQTTCIPLALTIFLHPQLASTLAPLSPDAPLTPLASWWFCGDTWPSAARTRQLSNLISNP